MRKEGQTYKVKKIHYGGNGDRIVSIVEYKYDKDGNMVKVKETKEAA